MWSLNGNPRLQLSMISQIIPELCHQGRFDSTIWRSRQRKSESNYRRAGQSTAFSARSFTEDRFQWSADCTSGPSILSNDHSWDRLTQSRWRSPPSIGGQFHRVSFVQAQFCESLTSLELVPRKKSKFPLLRNKDDCRVQISRFILLRRRVYS